MRAVALTKRNGDETQRRQNATAPKRNGNETKRSRSEAVTKRRGGGMSAILLSEFDADRGLLRSAYLVTKVPLHIA